MRMSTLNPKDYDYLWTDYEVNFIFTSCYLFKEFKASDMVLMYDWQTKGLHFFLSKKQREIFSKEGIAFYERNFPKWKEEIKKSMEEAEHLIAETKDVFSPQKLLDNELQWMFLELVAKFQRLAESYFFTEFFFLEKAEKTARDNKRMAENLKEMGKIKFEAREILNKFYNYDKVFRPYIEEIEKRTKVNNLQWYSWEEINKILKGNNVKELKREKSNWTLTKKNDWKIILGKEAEKIKGNFEKHFFKIDPTELKGMCANKGFYKGTAKILRTVFSDTVQKEIAKVSKGDILIANTTGPEVMAACMKAGAIVTDEGGLTSHAAIVSRELGIPCVVGCKLATKIFRDGDLVEVDATKGTVTKL